MVLSPVRKALQQPNLAACTDVIQQVKMLSPPPPSHVKKFFDFISALITPITTKLGRMVDRHALNLPCDDGVTTNRLCYKKIYFYLLFYEPSDKRTW